MEFMEWIHAKMGSCTWAQGATNTTLVVECGILTIERVEVDYPKTKVVYPREGVKDWNNGDD